MADNRELPVIQRNVSPVYKGFFNYQIKDSGTPDNYNWEPSYEDIRLNNRFEHLSNHGLDVFGGDIDSLVELLIPEGEDCGCDRRKAWLNKQFPYKINKDGDRNR